MAALPPLQYHITRMGPDPEREKLNRILEDARKRFSTLDGDITFLKAQIVALTGVNGVVTSVNGQQGDVTISIASLGGVPITRTISSGQGLTGGGNLSADRTLSAKISTDPGNTITFGTDDGLFSAGGGGGGQVDEVQAGDFINVDSTDPTKPIVSVPISGGPPSAGDPVVSDGSGGLEWGAGGPPYITGIAPPADLGDSYSFTPVLNNPGSTVEWEITDGAIPASASLNNVTGEITSAMLLESGTFNYELAATIKSGAGAGATCFSRQRWIIGHTDPYWSDVSALLHFDGLNGSTTFPDETANTTWTASGDAKLTTSEFRFGGASLNLDGTGDWADSSASAGYSFGTGDFTIEGWFRPESISGNRFLWGHHTGWGTYLSGPTILVFNGSTNIINTTFAWAIGSWYHVALTRSGSTIRIFVNGTLISFATNNTDFNTTNFRIGAQTNGAGNFQGQIDEFRVTKGVARYTSGFTPIPAPFPD
jgi:hypothetical protein